MIAYTKTKIQDVALEVEARIKSFVNEFNYDADTMLFNIVYTCRKLIMGFIPYQNWSFLKNVEVQHRSLLPDDFLKEHKLIITNLNTPQEARRVDIREWYKITNWRRKHDWNVATIQSPAYTITGITTANSFRRLCIFIAPNNDFQVGAPPPGYEYYTGPPLTGTLEYYGVPTFDLTWSDYLPLPDRFKDVVVLEVVARFLSKYIDHYLTLNIHKELYDAKMKLWDTYVKQLISSKKETDTFVDIVPPLASGQPLPGELPQVLK